MDRLQRLLFNNAKNNLLGAKTAQDSKIAMSLFYQAKDGFANCAISTDDFALKETCRTYLKEAQELSWNIFKQISEHNPVSQELFNSDLSDICWTEGCILSSYSTFDDIIGMDSVKDMLLARIVYSSSHELSFKVESQGGILMYGPPGCGKTYLVCAAAGEIDSDIKVYDVKISDVISKWVGDSEKSIKAIFDSAKLQKSIIFLDEIDALTKKRDASESEASLRFISTLLVEMDGASSKDNNNITIIGSTNRPDMIDDAILSRLPMQLYVGPPDKDAKISIINNEIKKTIIGEDCFASDVNPKSIYHIMAKKENNFCSLYSGRDIKNIISAAGYNAIIRYVNTKENDYIILDDFRKAIDTVNPAITKENLENYKNFKMV
ncbi:MAG: ATP-binding protein [DPANN group archaeon]|nr:ATP-binding protein [DPANN group archaeon]